MQTIFTIGHSTHTIDQFIQLLTQYEITCVIDVRSMPYSKYNPQFNKETLAESLKQEEILYVLFDKEFGARQLKPSLLDEDGKVDFYRVRETDLFKMGVHRLHNAVNQGYRLALMCSEGNPLDCHRFSMICYQLKKDFNVMHILPDGGMKTNEILENELVEKYKKNLPQSDLWRKVTEEERLEAAYRLVSKDIAYEEKD